MPRPKKTTTLTQEQKAKRWRTLTRAERKVEIAKDVIKHIQAENLNIRAGWGYVVPDTPTARNDLRDRVDARSELDSEACDLVRKSCAMCARGALLISRVDVGNKLGWSDIGNGHAIACHTVRGLKDSFTISELKLIEAAFERNDRYAPQTTRRDLKINAREFGNGHADSSDRLLAIMQNIVDHDGEFKPEVLYEIQ